MSKAESDAFKRGYIAGCKQQKKFVAQLQKRRNELVQEVAMLKDKMFYLEAYFETPHKED